MSTSHGDDKAGEKELGSLTQSARRTSLTQARSILIVIGVLSLIANIVFFVLAEDQVRKELRKEVEAEKQKRGPGLVFDQNELKKIEEDAVRITRMVNGGAAFLGVVFVALGLAVYRAPVVCTVTGLILYVAGNAVFAAIDPENLVRGIIIKVIIVVAMVKAVQAALAYEREAKVQREAIAVGDENRLEL